MFVKNKHNADSRERISLDLQSSKLWQNVELLIAVLGCIFQNLWLFFVDIYEILLSYNRLVLVFLLLGAGF